MAAWDVGCVILADLGQELLPPSRNSHGRKPWKEFIHSTDIDCISTLQGVDLV